MKSRWVLYFLATLLVVFFINRGFWQLDRAQQKAQIIEATQAAINQPDAVALNSQKLPAAPSRARVTGEFLPELWLLDNQRLGERLGVRAYQLFEFSDHSDQAKVIAVELGWVDLQKTRDIPQLQALVGAWQIEGLWLEPVSAGLAMGNAAEQVHENTWLWLRMDEEFARQRVGDSYVHKVLRPAPDWPHGFHRDTGILANTLPPEKHRGYALQWFGFAVALTIIVLILSFRHHE